MRTWTGWLAVVVVGCSGASGDPGEPDQTEGSGGSTVIAPAPDGATGTGGTAGTGGKAAAGGATGTGGKAAAGGAPGSGGAKMDAGACDAPPESAPGTPMDLVPGVWTNITPSVLALTGNAGGALCLAIDPNNASVVYVGVEETIGGNPHNGIYRTTNGGKTWVLLGTPPDPDPWDNTTNYIDLVLSIDVDPQDSNHLQVASGVRGANQGFWDSTDGGASWARSPFPKDTSNDVTMMARDPCDWNHILVSSHSDWGLTAGYSSGLLESKDGGKTWTVQLPPNDAWGAGTKGVFFLHNAKTGQGDGNTWLVSDDGFYRTTDAGGTWTRVSDGQSPHGTNEFYYSSNGDLYAGAVYHLQRSTDNGLSWQSLNDLPNQVYYAVTGDGANLYTMPDGYPPATGYWTAPESNGASWKQYSDTTKPGRGPIHMRFDPVNRIVYSVNWDGGVWALKVTP
jgi:photosystem II stability/assembly factor-like uncharacterized protein